MEEGEKLKPKKVDELSKELIRESENLREMLSEKKNAPVLVHKALSPTAVNTLAVEMLEACISHNEIPPQSLCDLIRLRLDADLEAPNGKSLKRLVREIHMRRELEKNPNIGPTELSGLFNIHKSTASK